MGSYTDFFLNLVAFHDMWHLLEGGSAQAA
jgi:hypothetical protein